MRGRRLERPETFRTEAELCAAFVEALPPGWAAYPETSDWDILLVRTGDSLPLGRLNSWGPHGRWQPSACANADDWASEPKSTADAVGTGEQVGVQAKLACNVKVFAQAVAKKKGPAFRAVLVANPSPEFHDLARHLRVGVFAPDRWAHFGVELEMCLRDRWGTDKVWVPPVLPEMAAGVPSPSPLSPWRVAAIRLCNLLRERGYLTKADFKAAGVDARRWTDRGRWLVPGPEKGQLVANSEAELPDVGWEAVAVELAKKDKEKSA